jgi:hypothetical protein
MGRNSRSNCSSHCSLVQRGIWEMLCSLCGRCPYTDGLVFTQGRDALVDSTRKLESGPVEIMEEIGKRSVISFVGKGAICTAGEIKRRMRCSSKGIGSERLSSLLRCLRPLAVLVFTKVTRILQISSEPQAL